MIIALPRAIPAKILVALAIVIKRYLVFFFFSSRRRHTRCYRDCSSDVCSSDLPASRATAGPWARAYRRLRKNRLAMGGAIVLLLIVAVAALVPLAIEIDPYYQDLSGSLLPPGSTGHPFGTDQVGRDVLLRLIDG